MHTYTFSGRSQHLVYFYLAVGAVASAWLLHNGLEWSELAIPWWVETPSVLGFYGLLWKWFDLYLWRSRFARAVRLVSLPDLRGEWQARAEYVLDGEQRLTEGRGRIAQTWTAMSLAINWPHSRSYSVAGIVQISPSHQFEFIYQYVNEPDVHAVSTMHVHRGTGWLVFAEDAGTLIGEYFSGRGRQQVGKLILTRTRHGG